MKKIYIKPCISVLHLSSEDSIVTASYTINPSMNNDFLPEIKEQVLIESNKDWIFNSEE